MDSCREIVLLGVGHTHAHVVREWSRSPIAGARLTCVSPFPTAFYSGMLPGTLAGQYAPEQPQIDLVQLCRAADARLVIDEVMGVDLAERKVQLRSGESLPFNMLSIGIGSVPTLGVLEGQPELVPIKPMQTFLDRLDGRLDAWLKEALPHLRQRPLRAVVIGGGAGGVEIALCLPRHLDRRAPQLELDLTIVHRSTTLVHGASERASRLLQSELLDRGVTLLLGAAARRLHDGILQLDDGRKLPVDIALATTHASAPAVLKHIDLPHDDRGFLLTLKTLETVGTAPVFVVGDSGTFAEQPAQKAGVVAVREGPVLWENLRRASVQERGALKPLREFRPRRHYLKIFNLGDGRAVLDYAGFAFRGRWCWRLKDRIDRRFMAKYQTPAAR